MAVLTMLMLAMTACSSDDDMNYSDNGKESSEDKKENGDVGIFVNFTLQDESGIEKYVFKEGENIIFQLAITNNTEKEARLSNFDDMVFHNNVFHVYSSQGEDFGHPYDYLLINEIMGPMNFPPRYTYTLFCPWINNPDSELPSWDRLPYYKHFITEKFRPLPKGEYYSEFPLRLDEKKTVTCYKSFIIE